MSVTVAPYVIRQRVASAIATALSASGWREATGTWDTFGEGDGEGRLHQGYAVGVPETKFKEGRQRASEGALVETTVSIKWAYQIAALDQVASTDTARAAEATILAAVASIQQSTACNLSFVSMSSPVDPDGWMMGEQTWTATHLLPLA